jgi:hypothetical protein
MKLPRSLQHCTMTHVSREYLHLEKLSVWCSVVRNTGRNEKFTTEDRYGSLKTQDTQNIFWIC